ncbi:MAG: outer membrane beta-barrel protein [Opitutaceae bacterium]|jgi:hypothetical protein|nr:outer membrane beta-barrel protein [Opitutaceae bacterium]
MNKKILTVVGLLASGGVFAAGPFLTVGDDFKVSLLLDAAVRHDDNVYLSNASEKDDIVFSVAPGISARYGSEMSKTSFTFLLSESFYRYSKHDDELNADLMSFSTGIAHRGEIFKISAGVSFNQYSNSSPVYLPTEVSGMKVDRNVVRANVGGEYSISSKSKIGLGFSWQDNNYRTAGYANSTDFAIPANFYFAITQKIDVSAGIQYRHSKGVRNEDTSTGFAGDKYVFNDLFYNVGVRGELTPKLSGGINVGFTTRDVSKAPTPDMGDTTTFGLSANLGYVFSAKTQMSLRVGNDYGTRTWDGGSQRTLSALLGVQSDLAPQWRVTGSIGWSNTDYMDHSATNGSARVDDYIDLSASVIYLFSETFSAAGGYMLRHNFSNRNLSDFTDNIFSVSVSAKY